MIVVTGVMDPCHPTAHLGRCDCPPWTDANDYDGWKDYADACSRCPVHGTGVAT